MKRRLAIVLVVLSTTCVFGQSVSKELKDMKDAISAQQQQIQQLQQQVQNRDQAIQALQQQVSGASGSAGGAADRQRCGPKAEACDKQYIDALQHDVADLKTVSGNTVNELQETQKRVAGLESPLAIHYKGITITPGGFLAAETVWRQRAEGADINTQLERHSVSRRFAGPPV